MSLYKSFISFLKDFSISSALDLLLHHPPLHHQSKSSPRAHQSLLELQPPDDNLSVSLLVVHPVRFLPTHASCIFEISVSYALVKATTFNLESSN